METDAKSFASLLPALIWRLASCLLSFPYLRFVKDYLTARVPESSKYDAKIGRALFDRGLDFNPNAHDLWMALLDKFSRQLAVVVQDHTGPHFCTYIEYSIKKGAASCQVQIAPCRFIMQVTPQSCNRALRSCAGPAPCSVVAPCSSLLAMPGSIVMDIDWRL